MSLSNRVRDWADLLALRHPDQVYDARKDKTLTELDFPLLHLLATKLERWPKRITLHTHNERLTNDLVHWVAHFGNMPSFDYVGNDIFTNKFQSEYAEYQPSFRDSARFTSRNLPYAAASNKKRDRERFEQATTAHAAEIDTLLAGMRPMVILDLCGLDRGHTDAAALERILEHVTTSLADANVAAMSRILVLV
jgi:hypothetical protein